MPLSEYEKQRLENIQRNQELLRMLEIPQNAGITRKRSGSSLKKHGPKKLQKEQQQPTRVSARLRGIAAEEAAASAKKSDEESKTSIKKEPSRIGKLDDDQQQEFMEILRNIPNGLPEPRETEQKYIDSQESLRDMAAKLEIRHEWATIKVTPDRISSLVFHPSSAKILVCAGDVSGNLGFWDVNGVKEDEEPVVYTYRPHTRSLTDMHFDPTDSTKLYTSSYDGTIQYFDMQHAAFENVSIDSYPFTSFDIQDNHKIWFSTSEGDVGSYDVRGRGADVHQLRDKKIGCIHLNPVHKHLLAAASNDRTLTVWDTRKIGKEALHEFEHGYAVTSAYWSPKGNKLATTSYDDLIRIFELQKSGDIKLQSSIRHNNHTGKWVTMFRARWNENPIADNHQHFAIGNMKHPADIISGETGDKLISLMDYDRITAIQAVTQFHPTSENMLLATANASGRVVCYS
ncbi:WD40-repeat-containing domain protein [Dichotomocladium elegans]|nr:WD40-repeat-containing domain protein [Dichotomocladium elegans]